jgi:hypothetical protein
MLRCCRSWATSATLAGAIACFVAVSEAAAHSLPLPKPWAKMTLLQRERYLKRQNWHAKTAIRWLRRHRRSYRGLALAPLFHPNHRWLLARARASLHRIQDRLVRAAPARVRQRVSRDVVCSFDWSPSSCAGAMRVSWCESRWTTWDVSGQFAGWFQLGSGERRRYGLGAYRSADPYAAIRAGIWAQVRSAHRYYVSSGRDWSPWQCRPSGLAW